MWGEGITKNMQNQHWQVEDVLIRHSIANLYVNEALLSGSGTTAFLDTGCADCSTHMFRWLWEMLFVSIVT